MSPSKLNRPSTKVQVTTYDDVQDKKQFSVRKFIAVLATLLILAALLYYEVANYFWKSERTLT
jgi:hypothetical protein